ncbi:choice-of-anchor E domain-containing protein [bacterium]|nr:choice-of-anchor E domain-containing protein [bacterium]
MRHHISLPMIALLALTLAGAAAADTISYTAYIDLGSSPSSGNIDVSQFDTSLGTLTAVTVNIYQAAASTFRFDNDDAAVRYAQPQMQRAWDLAETNSTVTDSDSALLTGTLQTLQAENGDGQDNPDYTAPDGFNWGQVSWGTWHNTAVGNLVWGDLSSTTNLGASDFWVYEGLGNVTYGVNMTQLFNSFATNAAFYDSSIGGGSPSNERITVEVIYTYDTDYVPEPGTMALLSLGIAGFGIWRRRRSS